MCLSVQHVSTRGPVSEVRASTTMTPPLKAAPTSVRTATPSPPTLHTPPKLRPPNLPTLKQVWKGESVMSVMCERVWREIRVAGLLGFVPRPEVDLGMGLAHHLIIVDTLPPPPTHTPTHTHTGNSRADYNAKAETTNPRTSKAIPAHSPSPRLRQIPNASHASTQEDCHRRTTAHPSHSWHHEK